METLYQAVDKRTNELERYNYIINYFNQNPHRVTPRNLDFIFGILLTRDESIKSLAKLNRFKAFLNVNQ